MMVNCRGASEAYKPGQRKRLFIHFVAGHILSIMGSKTKRKKEAKQKENKTNVFINATNARI